MKFVKYEDGSWSAHQTPFAFYLFEQPGIVDIVWHYGQSSGGGKQETLEEAKSWCYKFAAKKTLEQLQNIASEEIESELQDRLDRLIKEIAADLNKLKV